MPAARVINHNRGPQEQRELSRLIFRRLDQGLTYKVIATRLGISFYTVRGIIEKGRLEDMANNEDITTQLETLRGQIRKAKSGMQTHELQDWQVATIKILDNIELDLRPRKKE